MLVLGVSSGYAQTESPEETPSPESENSQWEMLDLTFAELVQTSFDLTPPASERVSFKLPYRWFLRGDNNFIEPAL